MKGNFKMKYIEDEFTRDLKADFQEIIMQVKGSNAKDIFQVLFCLLAGSVFIISICLI
jgi:pyruvate-formate lyase-activating enzyme